MATCNVANLIAADPCLAALDDYTLEVVITQQLCGLFNNLDSGAEISCDIQTLLNDAECLYGRSIHELKVIQAQLLCEIISLIA
jgi:hypothetical protein